MKRIAEALVECGYADKDTSGEVDSVMFYEISKGGLFYPADPFADTLEGHRQLMALYFYTLQPDKQHTITGDGHFDAYEQIKNHVRDYFEKHYFGKPEAPVSDGQAYIDHCVPKEIDK